MCRDLVEPTRGKEFYFYHAFGRSLLHLQPIVNTLRWVRWLHLERALAVASTTGDLLPAALILRTQIEELSVLCKLQTRERETPHSWEDLDKVKCPSKKQCQLIRSYAILLRDRVLPRISLPSQDALRRRTNLPKKPQSLDKHFLLLNDYVHPNYGSHVVILRPEQSSIGEVVLKAFVAIYQEFFALDWASETPAKSQSRFEARRCANVATVEIATFVETTVPDLEAKLKQFGFDEALREKPSRVFRERLEREAQDTASMSGVLLRESDSGGPLDDARKSLIAWLGPLCQSLDQQGEVVTAEQLFDGIRRYSGLGLAPSFCDNLLLASLRGQTDRLEAFCRQLNPAEAFPSQPPYDEWIDFMLGCGGAIINITAIKMKLLGFTAIRMLNARNPLGAVLCARALLEHYACAQSISDRVHQSVKDAEAGSCGGLDPRQALDKLEAAFAVFLSGTKHTDELSTIWKTRFEATRQADFIDLKAITEEVFPKDSFMGYLYALFCRAIHGEMFTGSDLHADIGASNADRLLCRVLMVITEYETIGYLASIVGQMWEAMWKLFRRGGPRDAENLSDLIGHLNRGMLHGNVLDPQRDVFGSGTIEDPFRFRPELDYHSCVHKYLRDAGLEFALATVHKLDNDGLVERVDTVDGQAFYFFKEFIGLD